MTDLNPELIERARRVLVDEGADSEGGWHSWRCFDRERYPEPCDCTAEISRAILEAVADDLRAEGAAEALRGAADASLTAAQLVYDLSADDTWPTATPEAVADFLRARADQIEAGAEQ